MISSRKTAMASAGMLLVPALVLACTGFLATGDDGVLFGNNEDFWNPNTRMWFVPGGDGRYGAVYFGFDDLFPQGGMNEAGLAFDGYATRAKPVIGSADKTVPGDNLMLEVMATCATVDEVLEVFDRYNLEIMERFMLMFADAGGNSVIIEGDQVIRKKGPFQVVTNFYQSEDPLGANAYGEGKSCGRFEIANQMLGAMEKVGIADARRVLNAVHAEGKSRTLYSNIYDLDDRLVYLYSFHDFLDEVVIDLARELEKGPHMVELPSLFPRNFAREYFVAEKEQAMEQRREARGSVELPSESLERFTGTYRSGIGSFSVTMEDGALVVSGPEMAPMRLTPESETTFYAVTLMMDYDVAYRIGDGGEVEGVQVTGSLEGHTFVDEYMERQR